MNVSMAEVILAATVGAGLGVVFFGGLLWTVRRLPDARHPLALAFGSFLVRAAPVVAGILWLASRHWVLALAALTGYLVVRVCLVRAVVASPAGRGGRVENQVQNAP